MLDIEKLKENYKTEFLAHQYEKLLREKGEVEKMITENPDMADMAVEELSMIDMQISEQLAGTSKRIATTLYQFND